MQVLDCSEKKDHSARTTTAASSEPMQPPKKTCREPLDEWNRMVVTCIGSHLHVELNGEPIIDTQLDKTAIKDRPLEGYIGFQDHGQPNNIRFRSIRLFANWKGQMRFAIRTCS